MKKYAIRYLKAGYSVIPVGVDKKPLVNWKPYQYKKMKLEEARRLFADKACVGIAVVTGQLSGLAVLDFEKGADIPKRKLKTGLRAKSGGGGRHYYYRYPKGAMLYSCTRLLPLMDLRAEGGYIILPPSAHKSGNRYEWIDSIYDHELDDFPRWMLQLHHEKRSVGRQIEDVAKGVDTGNRNESATTLIGTLMTYLPYYLWEQLLWPLVKAWNSNNQPPMRLSELRNVYKSIGRRAMKNNKQQYYMKRRSRDAEG